MPNQIPVTTTPHRLAIIGEGPVEEERGIPFSGNSGRLVSSVLSTLSLPVSRLFLGYVSTKRTFKYPQSVNDPAVIEGSETLRKDLAKFKPNCCLLLGDLACKVFGAKHAVHYLRGSIFNSTTFSYKCVATFDPWQVVKQYSRLVPFQYDFLRAKEQSLFPDIKTRPRTVLSWPSFSQLRAELEAILTHKPRITFDLEGYPNQTGITCFSIATSPSHVFAVPLRNMDNSPFWSFDEECEIWRLTASILGDSSIKKVAQNAMYELFVFAWRHKILVQGLTDDTMFRMWEVFSELPKGLDFISSVYTEEPYYKDERTVPDLATHLEYCCKDSLVTCEANEKMNAELKNPKSREHYQFNISLLKPYLYMQLRGCRLDLEKIAAKRARTWDFIRAQQDVVNQMSSQVLNTKSPKQLADFLYGTLGLPPQYVTAQGKKTITTNFNALCTLYQETQLPVLLEIGKLTRSRTRFSDLNKLQAFADGRIRCTYNPVGTDTGRLSSAETWVESVVTIPKIEFKKRTKNKVAYLEMVLNTKQLVENLGTNMQNVTKDLRDCFIPDNEDYDFFQYDLSGADAWTVAADLAALGNDKMLIHLQHGIKPSVVIVLLTEHGNDVYQWDLEQLKAFHDHTLKQCKTDPRLVRTYTGAKGCQHGTNYGMQPTLMASLQLERAIQGWCDNAINGKPYEEPIFKSFHKHTMERLQNLYIDYYGLELRNDYLRKQLCNHGYIDAASGQRRYFLDIRSRKNIEDSIIRVAASHEPQANTTFATNSALANLYYDRDNRTPRGNLRCEPTLMIHDALAGQAHRTQRAWATDKFENHWFDIPLLIHGLPITIPVEGGWGSNWKDTD